MPHRKLGKSATAGKSAVARTRRRRRTLIGITPQPRRSRLKRKI